MYGTVRILQLNCCLLLLRVVEHLCLYTIPNQSICTTRFLFLVRSLQFCPILDFYIKSNIGFEHRDNSFDWLFGVEFRELPYCSFFVVKLGGSVVLHPPTEKQPTRAPATLDRTNMPTLTT